MTKPAGTMISGSGWLWRARGADDTATARPPETIHASTVYLVVVFIVIKAVVRSPAASAFRRHVAEVRVAEVRVAEARVAEARVAEARVAEARVASAFRRKSSPFAAPRLVVYVTGCRPPRATDQRRRFDQWPAARIETRRR